MPRQVIPIPADRAGEFDLTVDIAIRPKTSWDDSRAWSRLRVPLGNVIVPLGREQLAGAIDKAINAILDQGIVIPKGGA